jgi:hypothetical protein
MVCLLQGLSASQLSNLQDLDVAVHTPKPAAAVPKPAEAATPDLMAQQGRVHLWKKSVPFSKHMLSSGAACCSL